MALLKAKQLDINSVTAAILNSLGSSYVYNLQFSNLVNTVNTFVTGYVYPQAVKNITVTNITNTVAQINWAAVVSATSYNVQINPKGDKINIITILGINTTSYIVSGLSPNTVYEVQVQAVL